MLLIIHTVKPRFKVLRNSFEFRLKDLVHRPKFSLNFIKSIIQIYFKIIEIKLNLRFNWA